MIAAFGSPVAVDTANMIASAASEGSPLQGQIRWLIAHRWLHPFQLPSPHFNTRKHWVEPVHRLAGASLSTPWGSQAGYPAGGSQSLPWAPAWEPGRGAPFLVTCLQ